MSKYGNKKVVVDGITFDSKAEARYYEKLKDSGESFLPLSEEYWVMQKMIPIQTACELVTGEKIQSVRYKADFVKYKNGQIIKVVDVKGYQDALSVLKMKMFAKTYGYPVIFAKYNQKTDLFEEMSCFESLRRQNQRAKLRRENKKNKKKMEEK